MTHEEVKKALTVLKSAYPNTFKNLSSGEAQNILALYTQMLSEYPSNVVFVAIKNYIKENEYAPTIAGIINEIKKITSDTTLQDLWNTLSSAVRNGLYTTEEEFQKLPHPIKKWLGNKAQLKELAMLDSTTFNTVTRGQFFKTIPNVISQIEAPKLPEHITKQIESYRKEIAERIRNE